MDAHTYHIDWIYIGTIIELMRHDISIRSITLAALLFALAHLETAGSGFSTSKNKMELRLRDAKSSAFHLQKGIVFLFEVNREQRSSSSF